MCRNSKVNLRKCKLVNELAVQSSQRHAESQNVKRERHDSIVTLIAPERIAVERDIMGQLCPLKWSLPRVWMSLCITQPMLFSPLCFDHLVLAFHSRKQTIDVAVLRG